MTWTVDASEFHIWYFLVDDIQKLNAKTAFWRKKYHQDQENQIQHAPVQHAPVQHASEVQHASNASRENVNKTFINAFHDKPKREQFYDKSQAISNYSKFVEKSHDLNTVCTACVASSLGLTTDSVASGTRGSLVHPQVGAMRTASAQFAAGAVGGCIATYTTHWLDTIKVRMQTCPGQYRSSMGCLRDVLNTEGVRGLYMGACPALLGSTTKAAIVFMSYGLCERAVCNMHACSPDEMTISQHATAGALTGILASFFLCPMELVKCKLQAGVANGKKRHPWGIVHKVVTRDGFRGLYRGLPGIWVKDVPGSFIYFGSYETAKSLVRKMHHNSHWHHSSKEVFMCGMIAGLCYCITHPIETVRTRVQVLSTGPNSMGFLRSFVYILKSEGLLPLWNGLRPSMLRSCLFSGIQFLMYEFVKERLMKSCQGNEDRE